MRNVLLLSACVLLGGTRLAVQTPAPQQNVPLYKTQLIANTDSGVFDNIYNVHFLSNGSMLAADANRRRLLLFDSTFKHFTIIADTAGGAKTFYGNSSGGIVPFAGDSAAFIDATASTLITVNARGGFGHVTTLPHPQDMRYLGGPGYGKPGFDVRGRLYYRATLPMSFPRLETGRDTMISSPDTSPVIRADLDARTLDMIAWVHIATQILKTVAGGRGGFSSVIAPISVIDDWAYDRDGTVAVVRGIDYHIDWYFADGTRKSTPKMPINWRRISDEEKKAIVDSVQHQQDSIRSASLTRAHEDSARGVAAFIPAPVMIVKPEQLPEYYPAIKPSSRPRFDLDGNLWIIPGTVSVPASDGGLVYDVFDRNGTLLRRVQIPAGRVLSGFAKGDIVYMTVLSTASWTREERARIVK